MPRLEQVAIALGVVVVVALPTALHGWPTTLRGNLFTTLLLGGGFALVWWRTHPRAASVVALGLFAAAPALGGWFPDSSVAIFSASFLVLALGWSGLGAWLVAACGAAYMVPFSYLAEINSWVAAVVITAPPFLAGTVLRLRDETAQQLAVRLHELEDERELYAEIALRHERARIASELHDIVGHAISVMVVQAAAGQRLVEADPERAREAFAAISESARQGTQDLQKLVELLGDDHGDTSARTDLSLVDEVVSRAGRSGLHVTCRFEGDRDLVPRAGGPPGVPGRPGEPHQRVAVRAGRRRPHRDQCRRGGPAPGRPCRERTGRPGRDAPRRHGSGAGRAAGAHPDHGRAVPCRAHRPWWLGGRGAAPHQLIRRWRSGRPGRRRPDLASRPCGAELPVGQRRHHALTSSSAATSTSAPNVAADSSSPLAQPCTASARSPATARNASAATPRLGREVLAGQQRQHGAGTPEVLDGRAQGVVGPALAGRDHGDRASLRGQPARRPRRGCGGRHRRPCAAVGEGEGDRGAVGRGQHEPVDADTRDIAAGDRLTADDGGSDRPSSRPTASVARAPRRTTRRARPSSGRAGPSSPARRPRTGWW